MQRTALPPGVVMAPPLWSISAEANALEMARVRHRAEQREAVTSLVTKHPAPWFGEPVTAAARTLERLAQSKGMRTQLVAGLDWCMLEGRVGEQRVGFRATWRRGRAESAWWFEPVEEWVTEPDTRPIGIAKLTRTTLAGHRSPGCDTRSRLVASPSGVLIPFAQITARVKALG